MKIALGTLDDDSTVLSKEDKAAVKRVIENAPEKNGTLEVQYDRKDGKRKVNYKQKVCMRMCIGASWNRDGTKEGPNYIKTLSNYTTINPKDLVDPSYRPSLLVHMQE